jgi:type IV secretory pathway VirJ component
MKKLLVLLILFSTRSLFAQNLPVTPYKGSDPTKPIIFYITGDGGWNSFSTSFVQKLNRQGFSVVGLNSKSYFWSKKDPQKAASDISTVLQQYLVTWNEKKLVLIGYSFGADVLPFIGRRLSKAIGDSVVSFVLMSPSTKTDFEIHVLGMIGIGGNSGDSVPDEVNRLSKPVLFVTGSDETDFPFKKLTLKNYTLVKLAGGHHYDGNVDEVVKQIVQRIR